MSAPLITNQQIKEAQRAYGIPYRKDRFTLFEPFNQAPTITANLDPGTINQASVRLLTASNRSFEIAGTNAVAASSVLRAAGGITLTCAGASADQVILQPLTNINSVAATAWRATQWSTDKSVIFTGRITAGASVATQRLKIGLALTNAVNTTTDDDQVFLMRDTGLASAGKWILGCSIGGTDTVSVTAPTSFPYNTQAASEDAEFRIEIGSDRVATAWINGERLGSTAALTTNKNLLPFIGIQALDTLAVTLGVRELMLSRLN
jgi:hypothetical protein